MRKNVLAIAALASMLASGAFAQQAYVGGAVGQGHVNVDCSGIADCSNNSTGYKLYGGYMFMPNIAGEVTYFDFGKAKASGGGASVEARGTGVGIGAAFFGEFAPQWSGVVRLGVASNRMKLDATTPTTTANASESSTQAYVGFGVGYEISKGFKLTGDVDLTRGKILGEKGNLRLVSVGANYAF